MNVVVCYVHVPKGEKSQFYLYRFFSTYLAFPSGCPHSVSIIENGGSMDSENQVYTQPNWLRLVRTSNEGHDIGAYIEVARQSKSDFLVCLGESCYFHRPEWLRSLLWARLKYGRGMYGILSSNLFRPHLNTTAFAVDGELLASYPEHVVTREQRYDFEHGPFPFWKWVKLHAGQVKLVTFDGVYEPFEWRTPKNILWRGDQSNCLVWCKHTDKWAHASPAIKQRWSAGADSRFQ